MIVPIRTSLNKAQGQINKLPEDSDERKALETDIKQLFTICAMWMDTNVSNFFDPIVKFRTHDIFTFLHEASSALTMGEPLLWRKYFNQQYPDARLSRKRSDYLYVLLAIMHFPNIEKHYLEWQKREKFRKIQRHLKPTVVTIQKSTQRLSFIPDSSDAVELNIEDHPLEVMQMVRSAFNIR